MRATTRRHGVTLIEMIVALLLLLLVLGVGSLTARRSIGAVASIGALESRSAALRDALTTLSRHVAGSEPHRLDLLSAHDSVLELRHTIGVSTLCHARIDTLVIGGSNDSLPWGAAMPRAVTTDDQLRLWDDHQQRWRQVGVRGVSGAGGVCGDSIGPRFGLAAQRVIIDDTLASIAPGAVVRVLQRERWSLLRGGDGLWALSLATWSTATGSFTTPQPLLAPLAAPTAAAGPGFVVRAVDAAGMVLPDSALLRTRSIVATLRGAPQPRRRAPSDSVRINVGSH